MEDERTIFSEALNSISLEKLMGQDVQQSSKNNSLSEIFRKKGNELYKKDEHDEKMHSKIWFYYCKSIATAVNGSEQLALAYNARSKILMHMGLYRSSMIDINRALNIITKSYMYRTIRMQLLLRKTMCLIALRMPSETEYTEVFHLLKQIYDVNFKNLVQKDINKIDFYQSHPPAEASVMLDKRAAEVDSLNRMYGINDFSAFELKYNEKYGRYLCATKEYEPGEVIFIERPFIRCIDSLHCHIYCSHCFVSTWTAIPCDHCSWIMFCSDDCKASAWNEYHKMECAVYSLLKENSADTHKQLVLRAFILGLKEFGSIENLQKELEEFDKNTDKTKGFMHDGEIHPHSSFTTIYSLCSDVVQSEEILQKHINNAALILKALAINTTYFGDNFDWDKTESYKTNEKAMFVGSLLLRLSKISQINGRLMRNSLQKCQNNWDKRKCSEVECCMYGSYIAPVTSLLNHSCDPNVSRCYSQAHTVIMFALKPIEKGEQIFDCYTESFYRKKYVERQETLSKIFTSKCYCLACEEKWSDRPDLMPSPIKNKVMKLDLDEEMANFSITEYPETLEQLEQEPDNRSILELRDAIQIALKKNTYLSSIPLDLLVKLQIKFCEIYGLAVDLPERCVKL